MVILIHTKRVLWKIGVAWSIIVMMLNLFDIEEPESLWWLGLLNLLVFFDKNMYYMTGQFLSNYLIRIKYLFRPPSFDNYECEADYILPFEGAWTAVNGGIYKDTSHSWPLINQRYAYDFVIMEDGKTFEGNHKDVESYFCYGENIIAPADGIVIKVSNKHRNSRPTGKRAVCDTSDPRGNFVIIKHAEDEFSLLAHLMPGSVAVSVGDEVLQGDFIGLCGNSGNTSEPHLHFQIQTSKSFLTGAGLPIPFVDIATRRTPNYRKKDTRPPQKELIKDEYGRIYIGRGLEVWNREQ